MKGPEVTREYFWGNRLYFILIRLGYIPATFRLPIPLLQYEFTGKLTGRGLTDGTAQPQKIK